MIRRPFMAVAMEYVGGILLARTFPLSLRGLALASICATVATLAPGRARRWALGFLVFLAGAAHLTWRMALLAPDDLRLLLGETDQLVTVRGRLVDTPSQRTFERNGQESWRTLAVVDVAALRKKDDWESASGRIAITTPGILSRSFYAGRLVELYGVLRRPPGPAADGLFDYRSYLGWQGIHYQLKVAGPEDWRIPPIAGSPPREPWSDRFCRWAQQTLALGLPDEDEPLRLIWAMALGWKTALTREVTQPFLQTGTMHIFAISGLHIALIAGILVSVLRVIRIPRSTCGLVVIPLIWFYTVATGWQASAIRSTVMMTIVIAGWALKRPGDLLNSLMAAAFLLLLSDPRQLFQASFQLSFFVVLSLALLMPHFEKLWRQWWQPDPLLPADSRPWWWRWLDVPVGFLATSLATSLAAWLGSFPLIAFYFHLVTPVGLLANLIVVPLSSLALMCHLGSLFCGTWLPSATVLFNHSGWFWMQSMIWVCQWAARLPGAYWNVRAPTPLEFILFYSAMVAPMVGCLWRPRLRWWSGGALALLGCLWLIQLVSATGQSHLVILAMEGSEAMVVVTPERANNLLIDSGNESSARAMVVPFVQSRGINQVPQFLVTHGDIQHAGGIEQVCRNFPINTVLASSIPSRSSVYRRQMQQWKVTGQSIRWVHRGDRIGCWTVLHPTQQNRFSQADNNALVLQGTLRDTRILLLSDLGFPGQEALMKREPDLKADIVVSGIPAQGEPLSDELLDRIQPRLIILNTSVHTPSGIARESLRQRLARRAIPVIYTSDSGTVTLTFSRYGWRVSCLREKS
jgi:DNA internalization-related competence protein ComEC/Rec2